MTDENRPDPDRLLAAARKEESKRRGRLKVFLGAAAGVGKTWSMLAAAHEALTAGRDVVVGLVETHGREDTLERLRGLPVLPRRAVASPGNPFGELDIDAALARRPEILVVDELAHTNAAGSRHPKRWQDVLELVDAGLEVWTAVNVQHLESVNDIVARLTGVVVRETVPDHVLDEADVVEVVDLPPGELIERLEAGKIYPPGSAERALRAFFREGNLIALRQLALRRAAERVGAQLDDYRDAEGMPEVWAAGERVLVAVGPSPLSGELVRVAARLARRLDAHWHAITIRPPHAGAEEATRRSLEHLHLAERLGATTAVLTADDVPREMVAYARRVNATILVLGASGNRVRDWLWGSLVDRVTRLAQDLEVHVVPGRPSRERAAPLPRPASERVRASDVVVGVVTLVVTTTLAWVLEPALPESDLVMVYLMGVVVAAYQLPRAASLVVALASVASFNFFFTEPRFTFYFTHARYLITFLGMASTGTLISVLVSRAKERARVAGDREEQARAMYALTRDLASCERPDAIAMVLAEALHGLFAVPVTVRLVGEHRLRVAAATGQPLVGEVEQVTADWVFAHDVEAGRGTTTLPGSTGQHVPLRGQGRVHGVVGFAPLPEARLDDPERRHLLRSMVDQAGGALERLALASEAHAAELAADAERIRSSLLSTVSHDLRTPLAVITGAATMLEHPSDTVDEATRQELIGRIAQEARRLERLIGSLVEMTRLEGGALAPELDWQVPEDVVGAAIARMAHTARGRPVIADAPRTVTLARFDAVLVEQLLVNYLENALVHAPGPEPIEVGIGGDDDTLVLEVRDRGPGVDPADVERLFQRFTRGKGPPTGGIGLGLAIAKAVADVHGGKVWARPREGGGAVFGVDLPRRGRDDAEPPPPVAP